MASGNGHPFRPTIPRTVTEGNDWSAAAAAIELDRRVFDAWIDGLIFTIARIPEEFDVVLAAVRVAFHEGSAALGIPRMAVTFAVSTTSIELIWVERLYD